MSFNFNQCGLQVIKLFHRKIHPESSIAEREFKNLHRNKINAPYNDGDYTDGEQMHQDKDKKLFPQGSRPKAGTQNYKFISKLHRYGVTDYTAASANGEHWIKTDANCKYYALPENDNFRYKFQPFWPFK